MWKCDAAKPKCRRCAERAIACNYAHDLHEGETLPKAQRREAENATARLRRISDAFRFLKISLHLELSTRQDFHAALIQLRAVSSLAKEHGDKAAVATAMVMEALLALRDFSDSEGFEQAQRALADYRSFQLDPSFVVLVKSLRCN